MYNHTYQDGLNGEGAPNYMAMPGGYFYPFMGDPDAQRLWDALGQHYGAELKTPVSVTREDWPVIEAAWAGFFGAREPWRGNGPEYPLPPGAAGG